MAECSSPAGSASPPSFDVHRLDQAGDSSSVVGVKLTDECIAALAAAQGGRKRLRLVVDAQGGGILQIGDESFRFSSQAMPTPHADIVVNVPGSGFSAPRTSVGLKYTIQATKKSFEDTRVKAQQMKDKERATKEYDGKLGRGKKSMGPSSSGAGGLLSGHHPAIHHRPGSRVGTPTRGGTTLSANASPNLATQGNSATAAAARQIKEKAEQLQRRKLRERAIHVVVTARYKSVDEVIGRLRRDGLAPEQNNSKTLTALVDEVSDKTTSRVSLKSSLFSEVDLKWPWFSQEEKAYVRKTIQNSHTTSTSFAPERKTGIQRIQPSSSGRERERDRDRGSAPTPSDRSTGSSSNGNSPDGGVPSVPSIMGPSEGGDERRRPKGEKEKEREKETPRPSPPQPPVPLMSKTIVSPSLDEEMTYVSSTNKRKAHVDKRHEASSGGVSASTSSVPDRAPFEKRPRQESSSPPEDPTMNKGDSEKHSTHQRIARVPGSSTSVSPRSPLSPPSPLTDWYKEYPEISASSEADVYFAAFTASYGEYTECHAVVSRVADEFAALDREWNAAPKGTRDAQQIEHKIQARYAAYERDRDFVKKRHRHVDLRSKLAAIKSRLEAWERVVNRQ